MSSKRKLVWLRRALKRDLLTILTIFLVSATFSKVSAGAWFWLNDNNALARTNPETSLKTDALKNPLGQLLTLQENSLFPINTISTREEIVISRINVVITGYSSSPWETDDTPYITASGSFVREGIIANNLFPFGTKLKIPEIFGEKIFVVEDRLNSNKSYYHVDVWFPSQEEAMNFGKRWTYIEIIQES